MQMHAGTSTAECRGDAVGGRKPPGRPWAVAVPGRAEGAVSRAA